MLSEPNQEWTSKEDSPCFVSEVSATVPGPLKGKVHLLPDVNPFLNDTYSDSSENLLEHETFPESREGGFLKETVSVVPETEENFPNASEEIQEEPFEEEAESPLGLKQKQKMLDDLKKENFGLKMRIYFLTETLQTMSPDARDDILAQYAELKACLEEARIENTELYKENELARDRIVELQENQVLLVDKVDSEVQSELCVKVLGKARQQLTHKTLENNIDQVQQQLHQTTAEAEHLAHLYTAKEEELRCSLAAQEQAEARYQECQAKLSLMTMKGQEKQGVVGEMKEQNMQLNQALRQAMDKVASLEAQLTAQSEELLEGRQKWEKEHEVRNNLDNTCAQRDSEIQNLLGQNQELFQAKEFLKQELEANAQLITSLTNRLSKQAQLVEGNFEADKLVLLEDNKLLSKSLRKTQKELTECRGQLVQRTQQLEKLECRLELMEESSQQPLSESEVMKREDVFIKQETNVPAEADPVKLEKETEESSVTNMDKLRARYILELKERNTCLVNINQKLDYFLPSRLDSSHIRNFSGLRQMIYEKLALLLTEWKGLHSSDHVRTLEKAKKDLELELSEKTQELARVNKKLHDFDTQFSHMLDKNFSFKETLHKREAVISEALKRLTALSGSTRLETGKAQEDVIYID